jgi:hypothetical protein
MKRSESIDLLTIIEAVEGGTCRRMYILRGGPCQGDGICDVYEPFGSGQDALGATLAAVSLASLVGAPPGVGAGSAA